MSNNTKGCPIHGLTWWHVHPSDPSDTWCGRCAYANEDVKLGDTTGEERNNGDGPYTSSGC